MKTMAAKDARQPGCVPAGGGAWTSLLRAGLERLARWSLSRVWRREPRRLRVCETLSLGNRGFLAVVGYKEQRFLVGGTHTSIALLAQLSSAPQSEPQLAEGKE